MVAVKPEENGEGPIEKLKTCICVRLPDWKEPRMVLYNTNRNGRYSPGLRYFTWILIRRGTLPREVPPLVRGRESGTPRMPPTYPPRLRLCPPLRMKYRWRRVSRGRNSKWQRKTLGVRSPYQANYILGTGFHVG